jgi:hypothetical protein
LYGLGVEIATGYAMDGRGSNPGSDKIFLFSISSGPALGPNQPPTQWLSGSLSLRGNGWGVKMTTHLHLVPRSRIVELYFHSSISLPCIMLN